MAEIWYVDMWKGDRIQEMKLAGIRRYAKMRGWKVVAFSEEESRPDVITRRLAKGGPLGCIVECSAAHRDLPPRVFGGLPAVFLDCPRSLYGGRIAKIVHDGTSTTAMAFRELASNRPQAYAVVGYRKKRPWSTIRVKTFTDLAKSAALPCRRFTYREEDAQSRSRRLAEWLAGLPEKSAVFAVNDNTAKEVAIACAAAGRKIPRDMTLLGVDNIAGVCEGSNPQISSIQVDFERAGYSAAKMLDGVLHSDPITRSRRRGGYPKATFGPMMVVRRESTRGFGIREQRVLPVVELIRREACSGLTAREAMRGVEGSRRLFEIRFREAMGHSVLNEILNVRLEQVCHLLSVTDTPIAAIAGLSGFKSDIALSKLFHRRFGMSLLAWRKANSSKLHPVL